MRACPHTELGFRNAETLGKNICDLKQVWYHLIPQWASPQTPWEPRGSLWDLCDCPTHLLWPQLVPLRALNLHLPTDGRTEMGRKRLCVLLPGCPGPVQGILSALATAGLPTPQISFIERDFRPHFALHQEAKGLFCTEALWLHSLGFWSGCFALEGIFFIAAALKTQMLYSRENCSWVTLDKQRLVLLTLLPVQGITRAEPV